MAAEWDTLLVVGSSSVDDTRLGSIVGLELLPGRIVVQDRFSPFVRVFDLGTGRQLWAWGNSGEGEGEVGKIADIAHGSDNTLWILDSDNRKVVQLSSAGKFVQEHFLQQLDHKPTGLSVTSSGLVVTADGSPELAYLLDPSSFEIKHVYNVRDFETSEFRGLPRTLDSAAPSAPIWVSAFNVGPGFFVADDSVPRFHAYIEDVWSSATRAEGRLRWGAHSVELANNEIVATRPRVIDHKARSRKRSRRKLRPPEA